MKTKILFFLVTFSSILTNVKTEPRNASQDLKTLVNNNGYLFEIHNVETKDGYILELHRVTNDFSKKDEELNKNVVLLVPGFADSSATYLISGRNLSLAYFLVDKGYDVWLSNPRGNCFSRKNKFYSQSDNKFWNFSWHEIGLYDSTAVIDYILNTTKQQQLFHVCHSQGCAEFYVMTSLNPKYNDKIILSINLAPAVFYDHPSLLMRIVLKYFYLSKGADVKHVKVFDQNSLVKFARKVFCEKKTFLRIFCYFGTFTIQGFDWFETDLDIFAKYLEYHPLGASSKQLTHYAKSLFLSGSFRQYDYGKEKNFKIYNSTIPPKYPLKKVTTPVVIFYGDSDNIVSVKDVEQLLKMVPNVVRKNLLKNFNHGAYIMHHNARELVNAKILNFFQNYKIN